MAELSVAYCNWNWDNSVLWQREETTHWRWIIMLCWKSPYFLASAAVLVFSIYFYSCSPTISFSSM